MREILDDVDRWLDQGTRGIAVATVLETFGSAPRKAGARLAISAEGKLSGSISGGCVEGSIIEIAHEVIAAGGVRVVHFESSDETAWSVGLPCGGSIDVMVEPLDAGVFAFLSAEIRKNLRAVEATVIAGPAELLGAKAAFDTSLAMKGDMAPELVDRVRAVAAGATRPGRVQLAGDIELFVNVYPPAPTVVAVGGVHIAIALVAMAKTAGFRTVVVDPRKRFGAAERFPDADRLLSEWPDRALDDLELTPETAVVVLTHDPKLDDPALERALASSAFYVGALGSQRSQERRRTRLLDRGFAPADVARIHGPVGLDIGSATPEEIALSILAEIVAVYRGSLAIVKERYAVSAPGAFPRRA